MTFIHELPGWPNVGWDSESLAGPLAQVRHNQGRLLGRMEALGFDLRSEANLAMLTNEVVKTSAIENENLDTGEVRSSIARRLGIDIGGLTKPSRRVDGVVDMMIDATANFAAELTEERLFRWHASLFTAGKKGSSAIAVGEWRPAEAGPMQVVSGPLGKERVHFEAPSAERLSTEMQEFLEWFNAPLSIDPVLKAGVAHFWFVTIHPFEDGNGRIARAIADMELARSDGTKDRFYSMSSQIEAEKKDYYWKLESAQRGDLDITPWLEWFLGCLDRSISSAEAGLRQVLRKARLWQQFNTHSLNERQRSVINRMLDGFEGFLTTSKYAKLAKCSSDSALRDIQQMLHYGILKSNPGHGRSTSYRLSEDEAVGK
jgi:Fic family protein